MTEFEKLVHRRDALEKELIAIAELSHTIVTGNYNKMQTVAMAGKILTDWRLHAIKSARALDVKPKVVEVCNRSIQDGVLALEKLSLQVNKMRYDTLQRAQNEVIVNQLFAILRRYLQTNTYPMRELECLEYLIASGDIKTPEQLAEYGVIDPLRR